MRRAAAMVAMLMGACSAEEEGSRLGSWDLVALECGGTTAVTIGLEAGLHFPADDRMDAWLSDGECLLTTMDIPVVGDELYPASGEQSCAPNPCSVDYRVEAEGQGAFITVECPQGPVLGIRTYLQGGGDELLIVKENNGSRCTERYRRPF